MKIFKIKFDSKMPTTRKVTVGKDDDFGLAIQIDGLQSQGPAKLLYAGQEVEANKDLIEGYNVFLLKAVKDSTISIKDVDSQVTFTVDISIKNTDVVELGGAGSGGGGDSFWEFDGNGTYSIPGVLSVNGCDGVIKNNLNAIYLTDGRGCANIGVSQDLISLSSAIMCVRADGAIDMKTSGTTTIQSTNDLQIIHGCFDQPVFKAQGCTVTVGDDTKSTVVNGSNINVCTTSGGITLNATGSSGLCMNTNCITMKYGCGWQVFRASPDDNCIAFGNCEKSLTQFGKYYKLYVSTAGNIIDATNTDKVIFGASQKNNDIVGHYVTLSATDYCGAGAININGATNISGSIKFNAQPCGGCATEVYLNGSYCQNANCYNVKFVLPNNLEFYGACSTCTQTPQAYYARSKVFLTLLSALETTYHNSCASDDTNYRFSVVDSVIYNKLTSLFSA